MIVDIDYLKDNVVNDNLYNLIINTEQATTVERLITLVENKVKLYIDISQFILIGGDDQYEFPDDLKDVVRYLVESLFLMKKEGVNTTKGKVTSESEKFDDYSKSTDYDSESVLFYDIPILPDYLKILDLYRPNDICRFGNFNVNV